MTDLIEQIREVWQLANIFLAVVGGFIGGLVCAAVAPKHTMYAFRWYIIHTVSMITALFTLFWIGQIAYGILSEDPGWGRAIGRFMLTIVFSVVVGIGVWCGLIVRTRMRARRERTPVLKEE